MRTAPPVSYPLGPCFFQQGLYLVITVLAAGIWGAWCWSQDAPWAQGVVALFLVVWVVWAQRDTRVLPAWLVWDGAAWRWETLQGQVYEGQLVVQWDGQRSCFCALIPHLGNSLRVGRPHVGCGCLAAGMPHCGKNCGVLSMARRQN
jgi:hypothetical protein